MTDAAAVRITGLTKRFGANVALDDVDLTVGDGEIHALLGGNGSGKSTLIKILTGVYRAHGGTIRVRGTERDATRWSAADAGAAGVHVVHQDPAVFPDRSVAENLALGRRFAAGRSGRINWERQHRRAGEVLQRIGVDIDPGAPVGALGPAMRTMVAIARALQDDDGTGVLILDEPTASLPAAEVELLLGLVRAQRDAGQTVVFVSHRMAEVFEIADTVSVLRDGRRVATRAVAEVDHRDIVELMVGGEVAPVDHARHGDGAIRLRIADLGSGPLRGVDLEVAAGEVVGIAGLLGSGRSTLLHAVFGDRPRTGLVELDGHALPAGSIRAAMDRGVALVPEDRGRDALFGDLSVRHNVSAAAVTRFARRWLVRSSHESTAAHRWIEELGIVSAGDRAPAGSLSGGNQQKTVLARWLEREPAVILLDEPTQGVDTAARATLHQRVRDAASAGAAVLIASSDVDELAEHCDRVAVLRGGRVAEILDREVATPQSIVAATSAADPTTDRAPA